MQSTGTLILNIITFIIVFGSILFIAYATTKYIASKSGKSMKGKHIQSIESISLGIDKNLHLIKAGDKFILLAQSGKKIEYLTTVEIDGYSNEALNNNNTQQVFDFKEIFEKYINGFPKFRNKKETTAEIEKENIAKDFNNNLSKLKEFTQKNEHQKTADRDEKTNED